MVARSETVFASEPATPAKARRFAVQQLDTENLELRGRVELLVSELVTNAVEHATGEVGVVVETADAVRVEVSDHSGEHPRMAPRISPFDASGRGLHIVDQLSDRWGVDPRPAGKAVWFEIDLDRTPRPERRHRAHRTRRRRTPDSPS